MILVSCPYDGRKVRQLITMLLKSGAATEIKRLNYAQSYTLNDKTIKKQEEKMLLIFGADTTKIQNLLIKNAPEAKILDNTVM
ncbi:MAG: hypothetical protein WCO66_00085 [Candidatus Absconditabacteria bacterium]